VTAPRAAPGWVLHPSREEDQTAFHARSPSGMDYVRLSELEAGLLAHMDGKRDEAQLAQQMQQHGYFCSTNYVREFIRRAGPLGLIQGAPLAPKPRSPLLARLFYIRVPLFDPSPHLGTAAAIWRKLVRPSMLLPAIALLCVALYLVLHNAAEFARSADQALHPRGLPWILGIALLSKSLHELAHAAAARRHGCEVREAGIVFLCMLPCLYVNTTDAWGLRDAHKRFEIAAAGLGMELLLGAVAALIWFASEGGVIHQIAFYLMAISWLSSLLFNANPLMRFDGYFMLADRLALPNLMQRSSRYLQHLIFGRFFGFGTPRNPSRTHREERILVIYGIASGLYRILLGLLIAKVMHARFDKGVGTLLFVATIWLFVLAPLLRSIQLLWQQRSEIQLRPLRTGIAAFFALLILAIAVLPLASHDVVPCVTFCPNAIQLTSPLNGELASAELTQRSDLEAGDSLLQLRVDDLEHALRVAQIDARIIAQQRAVIIARSPDSPELAKLAPEQAEALARTQHAEQDLAQATVQAPAQGRTLEWSPGLGPGRLVHAGEVLGRLLTDQDLAVQAVLTEAELSDIQVGDSAQVWFAAYPGRRFAARIEQVESFLPTVPQHRTPEGPRPARTRNRSLQEDPQHAELFARLVGKQPRETYYIVTAVVPDLRVPVGLSGQLLLPSAPRPLAVQAWSRAMRYVYRELIL
jgi:putative peptide zinc metalloprotease protein